MSRNDWRSSNTYARRRASSSAWGRSTWLRLAIENASSGSSVPSMCRCSSAFGRSTSSSRIKRLPALGHGRRSLRHLVGRDVLDVGRDAPPVAPRVLELRGPVAVELVLERPDLLGTRLERGTEGLVDVLDVDRDRHG